MKKIIGIALGAALVIAFAPGVLAQQGFESTLQGVATDLGGVPYLRYYTPSNLSNNVNPNAENVCPVYEGPGGLESPENYCGATYVVKKQTYRAYSENTTNFDGAPSGLQVYAVWDFQAGTGADRTGYYAWAGQTADNGETSLATDLNCIGTSPTTCLGPLNPASATGTDVAQVPGGTIAPRFGLRPMPVPRASTPGPGIVEPITLSWDQVSVSGVQGAFPNPQYDIYFAKDGNADGACDARGGQFTFLRTVDGTTTTVTAAELGEAAGNPVCVAFALRIRYAPAGGVSPIISRYFSRAGQAVNLNGSATAAEVYDLGARRIGAAQVEVSWKTSLEDGVRGFYVTRAFAENGTFERVSNLITAKGEPSAYSFIDTAIAGNVRIPAGVKGVFYKVESVDIDDNVTPFGPVRADLGGVQTRPGRQQVAPNRR